MKHLLCPIYFAVPKVNLTSFIFFLRIFFLFLNSHFLILFEDWDTFYKTVIWARYSVNPELFIFSLYESSILCSNLKDLEIPVINEIFPKLFFNFDVIQRAQLYKQNNFNGVSKINGIFDVIMHTDTSSCKNKQNTNLFEDIGLSASYYNFNIIFSSCANGFGGHSAYKDRWGEYFLFFHQQLVALFHLHDQNENVEAISTYEQRLLDAIDAGFFLYGSDIQFFISTFADLFQGSSDNLLILFINFIDSMCKTFGQQFSEKCESHGTNYYRDFLYRPELALKDPKYWMFVEKMIDSYKNFTENSDPYTQQEIGFDSVSIKSIDVGDLFTNFDYADADITNAVNIECRTNNQIPNLKLLTQTSQNGADFVIKARQCHLNHNQFKVTIKVESLIAASSVVRIFLAPEHDESDQNENRFNFVLLDQFNFDLVIGLNAIRREVREFTSQVRDILAYFDLFLFFNSGNISGMKSSGAYSGFPNRLLLPKGEPNGKDYVMFVHVSPYHACDPSIGMQSPFVDALPFGFPFDRRIDSKNWNTSNMAYHKVTIFHKKVA